MKNVPCIYFLILSGRIVYIGKTKNVQTRIPEHATKEYDTFRMIPCDLDRLSYCEMRLIKYFKPEYNVCGKGAKKVTQTFRLDSKILKLAKKYAEEDNRNLSNFFEMAVIEYLETK